MGNSMLDQLRNAGLVDSKQAEKADKEKRKQAKLAKQSKGAQNSPANESKLSVQKTQAEKIAHDRELNQQRKQAADKKSIVSQIKELIEMHPVAIEEGDVAFNFTDGGIVQRIYVTKKLHSQLVLGTLAIVSWEGSYPLVSSTIAEKIALRDPSFVVLCNTKPSGESSADDPYADYQVPDDLMW